VISDAEQHDACHWYSDEAEEYAEQLALPGVG